jgi:hypothetical protein
MRVVHPRVLVEYYGGPADGTRERVAVDDDGVPSAVRKVRHTAGYPGLPLNDEYIYDRHPAPDDAEPSWIYVIRPAADDGTLLKGPP